MQKALRVQSHAAPETEKVRRPSPTRSPRSEHEENRKQGKTGEPAGEIPRKLLWRINYEHWRNTCSKSNLEKHR